MRPPAARPDFARRGVVCLWIGFLGLVGVVAKAQLPTIDPAFPAGAGPDNVVRALARQFDGRWLVAGWFTNINGVARPRFAIKSGENWGRIKS